MQRDFSLFTTVGRFSRERCSREANVPVLIRPVSALGIPRSAEDGEPFRRAYTEPGRDSQCVDEEEEILAEMTGRDASDGEEFDEAAK